MRGCHRGNRCSTHNLWMALGKHIYRFLDVVTIQQVVDKNVRLDAIDLPPVEHYLVDDDEETNAVPVTMEPRLASTLS
jgi:Rrf2 family iron-sulfur cluster assembly transcriptional regulator